LYVACCRTELLCNRLKLIGCVEVRWQIPGELCPVDAGALSEVAAAPVWKMVCGEFFRYMRQRFNLDGR
jgi:hypothetical protein